MTRTVGLPLPKGPAGETPGLRREARRAPGSWHPWEMGAGAQRTGVGGKPCLPPVLLLTQVPWSAKWGKPPQTRSSAVLGSCCPPKGRGRRTRTDGDGGRGTRGRDGRMDGQTGVHAGAVIREPETARMRAREIQKRPKRRASHLTESTAALRKEPYKMPAASLIHQFFASFQICLLSLSSETGSQKSDAQTQPKGRIKPFPRGTAAHPAEVFPSSTNEKDPPLSHSLKNPARDEARRPRKTAGSRSTRSIAASRAAERNRTRPRAILKTSPELPCSRSRQGSLSLLRSPARCRMLQASRDTGPGLRSQDAVHHSPKQDLLSDPALNTSTDGGSTALLCDLV